MDRCQKCNREIDPENVNVLATKPDKDNPAKFWCSVRCLNVRSPDLSQPQPHFE